MSLNKSFNKTIIYACITLGLGTVNTASNAALSISEPNQSGSARISWGGADGLSQARTIMYSNHSTVNNTVNRVDNGYPSVVTPTYSTSNYSTNSYTSNYDYNETLPVSTRSRGVLVLDLETNRPLYEKNADIARPIASISKIMTAMVVIDANLDMSEEIVLVASDFVGPKKAGSRLKVGDRMNRAEMLLMTLMKSENPAAKSLARTYPGGYDAFMRAMNAKAQSLGMTSAFFGDPTGLDKRNVASPTDLAKMVAAARQYEQIRRFSTMKNHSFNVVNFYEGNRTYNANNTSRLVRDGVYPISMSKTGFINEAGRCVVMETQINNRPAVVVILGASSSPARWDDAENILNSLYMRRTV